MIHLLAKYGGRWRPVDRKDINSARRSLLKMSPDYTVEFAWIMQKYGGCARADIEALVRTPTMKQILSSQSRRLHEILDSWSEASADILSEPAP